MRKDDEKAGGKPRKNPDNLFCSSLDAHEQTAASFSPSGRFLFSFLSAVCPGQQLRPGSDFPKISASRQCLWSCFRWSARCREQLLGPVPLLAELEAAQATFCSARLLLGRCQILFSSLRAPRHRRLLVLAQFLSSLDVLITSSTGSSLYHRFFSPLRGWGTAFPMGNIKGHAGCMQPARKRRY